MTTTCSTPILFGDTVGAPQWLTNEIINGIISSPRVAESLRGQQTTISDQQTSTCVSTSADNLPPLIPPAAMTESESESDVMETSAIDESTPSAPPTSTSQGGDIATALIGIEDTCSSDNKDGHSFLRRSSRKPQRIRHFSEDSEAHLSDVQIRRKRKGTSSGSSQLSRVSGKRRRASEIETSREDGAVGGGGHESGAKRACWRDGIVSVDLEPLELGAKFKAEVEALNREEKAVVSP